MNRDYARDLALDALRLGRAWLREPANGKDYLRRIGAIVRAEVLFRRCEHGPHVYAFGHVRVVDDGTILLGDRLTFVRGMLPTEIVCDPGGQLVIGARCVFNYGVSLHATRSIRIGERCMFGSQVRIRDANEAGQAPVVLGNDVWLAHGVIVEPGVTIGDGSVVAAGSVVRSDVPPHMLASGNPAVCAPLERMPGKPTSSVVPRARTPA